MRKTLSGLLKEVRACFNRIEDPIRGLNQTDCLMSGLAVFGMKYLLKFDEAAHSDEKVLSSNAVRCRSRAVGHARTARRSGAAAIAALFHEAVPAFETRKGIGCLRILHPSTELDTFRRTGCTVKTAARNIMAPLPTIILGAGAPGRRFSRLAKDGAKKERRGDAASGRRASRTSVPEAGGGRAGPGRIFSRGWTCAWERSPETTSFWWVNSAPSVEHQEFTDENDIRLRYGVQRYAPSK